MESPAEAAAQCTELAFMMGRARITSAERHSLAEHMETCTLCREAYPETVLRGRAAHAVAPV